jgi:competence protein ComEA
LRLTKATLYIICIGLILGSLSYLARLKNVIKFKVNKLDPKIYQYQINVNVASQAELTNLPGIGTAMATRIIDYRNQNGSFESFADLEKVKGLGPKKINRIKQFITLSIY